MEMDTMVLLNKYTALMSTIEHIFYSKHTIVLALYAGKQEINN